MKVKVNSNVIINEKKINDDLEKFANICATTIIEEAAQMIARFARKQMSGYYTEYYPRIYDRTDQMINASYKPFTSSGRGVYEGGVIINSENTNHKRGKSFSEEDLYDNVWIKGIHGYENIKYNDVYYWKEIQGMPDRINKLKRAAYSKGVKEKLLSLGINKAKSQSYSILNF